MDDDKSKFERVKQHLRENKKTYILCGVTGVVCFAGGKYLRRPIVIDFQPVIDITNAPVFNNHIENNLGRVSKIVRDVVTGQEWAKIRYLAEEIAKEHGISYDHARTLVSQNVHGLRDHVFGKTYEIAGLRTDV
jgi:hypothetical protein